MAPELIGASRRSCETYISPSLRHWAHRKNAFDDVMPAFHGQFPQARKPCWRFRTLSRHPGGACRDDEGRSAFAAAYHGANMRSMIRYSLMRGPTGSAIHSQISI